MHAPLFAVDLDFARFQRFRDLLGLGAAQQRVHARHQLRHREGLHHIVVGARREAAHALGLLAARGQDQDRQPRGLGPRAEPARELDAGKARQHPIEDREIRRLFLQPRVGLVAAHDGLDLEAFSFEVVAKKRGERFLVLNDHDPRLHASFFLSARHSSWSGLEVSDFGRSSESGSPTTR